MKHLVCIGGNFHPTLGLYPQVGEIVTFLKEAVLPTHIVLKEYQFAFDGKEQCFKEKCFREVDDTFGQYCEDTYLALAQIEEAIKEGAI